MDILIEKMWDEGDISNCEDEIARTYGKLQDIFMTIFFIKTPKTQHYFDSYVESSIPKDDEEHGSVGSSAIIDDTTTDISDAMEASDYGLDTEISCKESEHGSMGSSAITDDPKSSGVAEAPGTCKYKDCEFIVSGKLKRSKINNI